MSEADIQALIEQNIGRAFEREDKLALTAFLKVLSKPRTPKVTKAKAEPAHAPEIIHREEKEKQVLANDYVPEPLVARDAPIYQKTEAFVRAVSTTTVERTATVDVGNVQKVSDRKEVFLKATSKSDIKRTQLDEEATAGPGVKDRLGNWVQVQASVQNTSPTTDVLEERLAEVRGVQGVKERYKPEVVASATPAANLVEERLAEVKGVPSVKERYKPEALVSSPRAEHLVQERLSEVAGVPSVKERYKPEVVASATPAANLVEERLAEVKGVPSVKERYKPEALVSSPRAEHLVQERLSEVAGVPSVKERYKPDVAVSPTPASSLVEERLAEVKGGAGVKERLTGFLAQAQAAPTVERKQPIELPTEEPAVDGH